MKRHAAILTATLLLCSAPAYAADLNGTWQIAITAGGMPTCELTQKGKVLSGKCHAQLEGTAIGSVEGKNVKWTWTVSMPGGLLFNREFAGQWDLKDTISGKVTFKTEGTAPAGTTVSLPPEPITFTATRQPAK